MFINLNYNSHTPLYVQIENQIRDEIKNPEYKKGKKLPNEVDLAKLLGVSRSTMRQAINKLVYDGLLVRLRGSADRPFVYFISYFNPRIGLTGNEDFSRPLYEILEKDYHTVVKLSKEEISARLADHSLADKLELKPGEPVLKRMRFVYDPGNRPVEWNVGYYRADSFVYTIESTRDI